MSLYALYVCRSTQRRSGGGVRFSGTGTTDGSEQPCGSWEQTQVLCKSSSAEPSLQPESPLLTSVTTSVTYGSTGVQIQCLLSAQ